MIKLTHTLFVAPFALSFLWGCISKNAKINKLKELSENNTKVPILTLSSTSSNQSFSYASSTSNSKQVKNSKHVPSMYLALPLAQVKLPKEIARKFVNSGYVTVTIDEPSSIIQVSNLGLTSRIFSEINWNYSRTLKADPIGPGIIPSQYVVTKQGILNDEVHLFKKNKFDGGVERQVVQDIHRFKPWIENRALKHRERVQYKVPGYENALDFRGRIYELLSDNLKNQVSAKDLNHRISMAMHYSTQTFDAELATILLPEFNKRVKVIEGESWRQAINHPENDVTFTIDGDLLKVNRTVVYEHFSTIDESFLENLGYTNREFFINLRTGEISPEEASIVWRNLSKEESTKAFSALLLAGSAFLVAAGIIHKDDIKKIINNVSQRIKNPNTQDSELDNHFEAEPVTLEIKEDAKGTIVGTTDDLLEFGFIEIKAGIYQSIQYLPKF